jgi:antirestriction protein ArdC
MKQDIYEQVTASIIQAIEAGEDGNGWTMPWQSFASMPENVASKKPYRGVNVPTLWIAQAAKGYSHGIWGTYKQWNELGAQVRKGEKGTPIVFWGTVTKDKDNESDNESDNEKKTHIFARYSVVFNACQVDGYELPHVPELPDNGAEKIAHVEQFIAALGANITHNEARAYYSPSDDRVNMPDIGLFHATELNTPIESYYSTMFHELTHWTGAQSRLDRVKGKKFGDKDYAYEELIAELGAAMACATLGVSVSPRQDHAQYIANWLKALKNDKKFIFSAASAAQKALDYMQGLQGAPVDPDKMPVPVPVSAPAPAPATVPVSAPATVPVSSIINRPAQKKKQALPYLLKLANKNKKLPQARLVQVKNGVAYATDFDLVTSCPIEKPDGWYCPDLIRANIWEKKQDESECVNILEMSCIRNDSHAMEWHLSAEQLKALLDCTSKEDHRHNLEGVAFYDNKCAATDGHKLYFLMREGIAEQGNGLIVPSSALSPFVGLSNRGFHIRITLWDKCAKIESTGTDLIVYVKLVDGQFPDFQRLIRDFKSENVTQWDQCAYQKHKAAIKAIAKSENVQGNVVILSGNHAIIGKHKLELPCEFSCAIGFDIDYLALAPSGRLYYNTPNDPIAIETRIDGTFLLMPKRI